MSGTLVLSTWGLSLLLLAAAPTPPAASDTACALPLAWKLAEISEAIPSPFEERQLSVLAWKVFEDDRHFRVETCLVLQELADGEGFFLAHLYRDVNEKGRASRWQVGMTHVSGEKGSAAYPGLMITHLERFETRPGNREIYAALAPDQVNWTFEAEEGWKLVGSGVCAESWREATGEAPTRFFSGAPGKAGATSPP